jgi:hypothetical protein
MDAATLGGAVIARKSEMVFHIAVAFTLLRHVGFFKLAQDELVRFPQDMGQHVESPPMRHAHDHLFDAKACPFFNQGIQERDQRLGPFERERSACGRCICSAGSARIPLRHESRERMPRRKAGASSGRFRRDSICCCSQTRWSLSATSLYSTPNVWHSSLYTSQKSYLNQVLMMKDPRGAALKLAQQIKPFRRAHTLQSGMCII